LRRADGIPPTKAGEASRAKLKSSAELCQQIHILIQISQGRRQSQGFNCREGQCRITLT